MIKVYLGLGSNLSEPVKQLDAAQQALAELPSSNFIQCSSYYSSRPMGPDDQPDYVNAVTLLETNLKPLELLKCTQEIELSHGRVRKAQQWGPRTLDIDILLFGNEQICEPNLVVPHYGMKKREFVLYPLYQLAPELVLPDGESLSMLIEQCPLNGLHIIEPSHS